MKKVVIDNHEIYLSEEVLRMFKMYQQDTSKKHEAGGILIGQIVNQNLEIQKITVPNKFDKSSRRLFKRNKDAAQIIINYEFYNSAGTLIYLGEWHTHPENVPKPSTRDIIMIKEQHQNNILNSDRILLIIVGLKELFVGIYNGEKLKSTHIPFY